MPWCMSGSRRGLQQVLRDDVDSIAFYDRSAERFAADTGDLDLSPL